MRNEDVAIQVDALHRFFVARKLTDSLFFTVLSARNETVLPDFVLNFTEAGFWTVLTATNLTFCFAMSAFYHCFDYKNVAQLFDFPQTSISESVEAGARISVRVIACTPLWNLIGGCGADEAAAVVFFALPQQQAQRGDGDDLEACDRPLVADAVA